MNELERYAKKIDHDIFIGYFGDTAQNIYDDGVGRKLTRVHTGLIKINKEFNRRSTKEVIDVINKVRNDDIKQLSIYDDCEGGSVKFYNCSRDEVNQVIKKYSKRWGVTSENKLHCLVLTNKIVAKYSGFERIYEGFKDTDYYKGQKHNQLNTELLSNELSKLGEIPKLLFNIINLKANIENNKTSIIEISPKEDLFTDMNIEELRNLISVLRRAKGNTLLEYIESISFIYSKTNNENFKQLIDSTLGFKRDYMRII